MFLKKIPVNFYLIVLSIFYYLLFVNKGIVIYDEGYYAHIAERILVGQIPYRDFFVQFTPGYFYLLAFFYKLLGISVITGRILTYAFCIGIVYLTLRLLDKFEVDLKLKMISFLAVISFGFPLINNMSLLAWPVIFLTLAMVLAFVEKRYILLGVIVSLILFTKQNIGIYFFILTNIFFAVSKVKIKSVLLANCAFLILTFAWFSYFFLFLNGFDRFLELLKFNTRYLSVYSFSYPSLSFLLQPTGIFKLLPYYIPIVFVFIFVKEFLSKKKNVVLLYFPAVSVIGFFGTVYPTSDLLHVYPFLGVLLVSSLLLLRQKKYFRLWRVLILIVIAIGFYLTLFREYYRYQPPYHYQKTRLELQRTQNIYVDQPLALQLSSLNLFFLINTKKADSILCYPFCPMMYFILERNNPTRFANYYPGYLTKDQENEVIKNLREKKTKFIITFLEYRFKTPISKFIQKQKKVYEIGEFKVFQID